MDLIRLRMSRCFIPLGYVVHLDKQSSEMRFRGGESVDGFDGSSDQTLKRNPLSYYTTGVAMAVVCAILVCGMVHIKYSLLLIGKNSPLFALLLSEWSFTKCLTPYNP